MQKEIEENQPTLRLCDVERPSTGSCGFHLSRTAWDPYPWVSGVEVGSAAEAAGLQAGDCVLEVNGEDVLGQRIGEVASRVRARDDCVTLLLWNAGSDPHTATSISGNGPTPLSLQRLSSCLQSVLQLLECPVCLETVPPPAFQCCNGHVLCGGCRARADRCPVCRVGLGPRGRCLLADKLHNLLTTTLNRYNQNKEKTISNKKGNCLQLTQQPRLYLKSRIVTEIREDTSGSIRNSGPENGEKRMPQHPLQSATRVVMLSDMASEKSSTQRHSEMSSEQLNSNIDEIQERRCTVSTNENVSSKNDRCNNISQNESVNGNENIPKYRVLTQPKASSEENISSCSQQKPSRRVSEQISTSSVQETPSTALRTRSLSAGQIPTENRSSNDSPSTIQFIEKILSCNEIDKLLLHCPYPMKSQPYCRSVLNGPRMLLRHLREVHQGPLVQYFLQPSCNSITLRLPLASSKTASSLMSFTTQDDVVFFVQIAAGATPGHRLVWLWLVGDSLQADRYRLRLTLPEGDTHTGPVFSLTASWSDVVNSNCCLTIEEHRYLRRNPEVQLEILDIMKTN